MISEKLYVIRRSYMLWVFAAVHTFVLERINTYTGLFFFLRRFIAFIIFSKGLCDPLDGLLYGEASKQLHSWWLYVCYYFSHPLSCAYQLPNSAYICRSFILFSCCHITSVISQQKNLHYRDNVVQTILPLYSLTATKQEH